MLHNVAVYDTFFLPVLTPVPLILIEAAASKTHTGHMKQSMGQLLALVCLAFCLAGNEALNE